MLNFVPFVQLISIQKKQLPDLINYDLINIINEQSIYSKQFSFLSNIHYVKRIYFIKLLEATL